ncbi:MAG: EAL domain-containing protein [Dokdonella sp.]
MATQTVLSEDGNPGFNLALAEPVDSPDILRLLKAAVLQSTEAVLITDAQLELPGPRIVFVNPAFTRMTGYTPAEVVGKTPRILQGPATDGNVLRNLRDDLHRQHTFSGEAVMYRKDGTEYVQSWQVAPIRNASDMVTHYASVQRDVTELRENERKIARLNRIRSVIRGVSSALVRVHDREDLFQEICRVAINEGTFALAWFGDVDQSSEELKTLATERSDLNDSVAVVADDLLPALVELGDRALRTRCPEIVNDIGNSILLSAGGKLLQARGFQSAVALPLMAFGRIDSVFVLLATEPHFFDTEEVDLLEWIAKDLSYALGSIENSRKLQHLTYFDALTGLANANLFRDRLGQMIFSAQESGRKVCVVVFDLENFTEINDTFGRALGDELLRAVANRLRDAFTEPCTLGRIGADTFALASPSDNELIASKLSQQITNVMSLPFCIGGQNLVLLAHAGIALFPDDSEDDHSVFRHAESALKLGKAAGQHHSYFSAAMNDRIVQRMALETELRSAIANEQFILHFQPRLDMISGEIVAAEALIRWQHPEKGLLEPSSFIALAEETGLIVAIGAWVIDRIGAQQAEWIAAGIPVVPIAANVSSVQLEHSGLIATVSNALKKHSLSAEQLHLELRESAVMRDAVAAEEVLSGLRKLGISLALDDFGTGYSSLAYLKRLPFSRVKIDRKFVTDITHNAEDSAIALAVIAIAHRMGLRVVAEGVETESQFNYLLGHGCDEMQGYYFSPAVTVDAFASFLRSGKRLNREASEDETRPSILVVDDEPGIRAALSRVFRRDGYRVLSASSGSAALELLALHSVQVVISDQRMPEMSGTEFLSIVKDLYPDTMRIILSGYTDLTVVTDSVNRGSVFRFLTKPWDDEMLREQVRDAFRRYLPKERLNKPPHDIASSASRLDVLH